MNGMYRSVGGLLDLGDIAGVEAAVEEDAREDVGGLLGVDGSKVCLHFILIRSTEEPSRGEVQRSSFFLKRSRHTRAQRERVRSEGRWPRRRWRATAYLPFQVVFELFLSRLTRNLSHQVETLKQRTLRVQVIGFR